MTGIEPITEETVNGFWGHYMCQPSMYQTYYCTLYTLGIVWMVDFEENTVQEWGRHVDNFPAVRKPESPGSCCWTTITMATRSVTTATTATWTAIRTRTGTSADQDEAWEEKGETKAVATQKKGNGNVAQQTLSNTPASLLRVREYSTKARCRDGRRNGWLFTIPST